MLVAGAGANKTSSFGGALSFDVFGTPSWEGLSLGSAEKLIGLY